MDKQQKIIILIFGVVLLAALVVLFSVLFGREREIHVLDFVTPPFDENAVLGNPTIVDEELGYRQIDVDGNFVFSMCGTPKVEDGKLKLYFTSRADNTPWLLVKVYNTDGDEIGKSGLLRAGEYVENITLTESPKNKRVRVKILSYEPETYYSMGSASAELEFSEK